MIFFNYYLNKLMVFKRNIKLNFNKIIFKRNYKINIYINKQFNAFK